MPTSSMILVKDLESVERERSFTGAWGAYARAWRERREVSPNGCCKIGGTRTEYPHSPILAQNMKPGRD